MKDRFCMKQSIYRINWLTQRRHEKKLDIQKT